MLLGFHLYDQTAVKPWEYKLLLIFPTAVSTLFIIIPYLGPFRKVSVLYTDRENNLYVDKILVDKNLIQTIQLETVWYSGGRSKQFYIMTFTDLPAEIKEKNFNRNAVVFSEANALSMWLNFKPTTEEYLYDIGVKQEIEHTSSE